MRRPRGFANLGANLTRTIGFGIGESVAKIAHQFTAQQSSWLKTLGPTIERMKESFYPPNLRGTEDLEFEHVEKVVMADSIALYGVPRAAIAEALIRAGSAAKRRQILVVIVIVIVIEPSCPSTGRQDSHSTWINQPGSGQVGVRLRWTSSGSALRSSRSPLNPGDNS